MIGKHNETICFSREGLWLIAIALPCFSRVWRKSAGNGFSGVFLQNTLSRRVSIRDDNTIGMEVIV